MIVISPTVVGVILHIIILNHVRSSTLRVNPSVHITENDVQNSQQQQRLNRRDNQLIRRMILMFCIFVGGWSPLYIYCIIIPDFSFTLLLSSIFTLWAKLCLLIDIINLYIYNYQLTKYLLHLVIKCSQIEQ